MTKPHLRWFLAACAFASLECRSVFSQTVAPANVSQNDSAALVLSPFEVKEDVDTGYLATSAQSGTRLRTDLKDIANAVQVITKDFMNDIGATDLEGLLVYTLGTEVAGASGNFSDAGSIVTPNGTDVDFDAAFAKASPSTRVRGLTSADNSRDFFITGVPLDGYVTDRVEITRGSNAMLFGLGSPSGIINNSLIRAGLSSNRTEVQHRTDQYATQRVTLDHNQVLLKDRLALRLAALSEKQYFRIEEAYEKDRRLFLTTTFRPFRNTTLRLNGERGEIESNRPETRPPNDSYSQWWSMGRPAYNPATGVFTMLGTPAPRWPVPVVSGALASTGSSALGAGRAGTGNYISTQIGAIGGGQRQMLIFFNNPQSGVPNMGLGSMPGAQGMVGGNINNVHLNPAGTALVADAFRGLRDSNRIMNYVFHSEDITFGFWKGQQITDPGIYNYYDHMLHGPNKLEWAKWTTGNVTLEQLFLDGRAGVELAANREAFDNGSAYLLDSTISGYTLRVDINSHLHNGDLNPNFGRPFVTAYTRLNRISNDRDTMRGTAFYDLDLRKTGGSRLGKILGRHRLTTSHTRSVTTSLRESNNWLYMNGLDYNRAVMGGTTNAASTAQRGAMFIRYLGPSGAASTTPVSGIATPVAQMPNPGPLNLLWYNEPTSTAPSAIGNWEQRAFTVIKADERDPVATRRTHNTQYTREKVNSTVGIVQSHWLEGKFVSTIGWRSDHVKTFNAGQPRIDPSGTGVALLDETYYPRPVTNLTERSFNWGAVLHAPNFMQRRLPFGSEISVLYNHSDNFRPAGQRYDLADNPIPHETGETKEYGVLLSTFNGKLVLRALHYETTSGMSSSLAGSINPTPINSLSDMIGTVHAAALNRTTGTPAGTTRATDIPGETAWREWFGSPAGQLLAKTFRVTEGATVNGRRQVLNNRRTGEVVATADVFSKGEEYELIYNPTRQWRISLNAARAEAVRSNVAPDLRRIIFDSLAPLAAGPAGDLRASETNEASNMRATYLTIRNQMLPELANEGAPSNELRKWRWNFVTNYSFGGDTLLKGFNVGGGIRWQDKIAYGFPIIVHPDFGVAPDVRHPYYGPAETSSDGWVGYRRNFKRFNWSVQMNVRNIGVGKELIPVSANPDGTVGTWRIAPEQVWTLRNTFTF